MSSTTDVATLSLLQGQIEDALNAVVNRDKTALTDNTDVVPSSGVVVETLKGYTTVTTTEENDERVTEMLTLLAQNLGWTVVKYKDIDDDDLVYDSATKTCSLAGGVEWNGLYKYEVITETSLEQYFSSNTEESAKRGYKVSEVVCMNNFLTSVSYMFYCCNVISINMRHVQLPDNSSSLLMSCYELKSIDLKQMNTSKVTNMASLFNNCRSLTSIDVSECDTSNVTNMESMFRDCIKLQSLDVSNWDTSKVTNMQDMFGSCSSLTSLDVSNWDTSKVTNMGGIFSSCSSLTSLDLSKWDTSKVTNMGSMFSNTSNLKSVGIMSIPKSCYVTNATNPCSNSSVETILGCGTIYHSFSRFITTKLDNTSIMKIINALYDYVTDSEGILAEGETYSPVLTLNSTLYKKLSADDIAVATAKGWSVTY